MKNMSKQNSEIDFKSPQSTKLTISLAWKVFHGPSQKSSYHEDAPAALGAWQGQFPFSLRGWYQHLCLIFLESHANGPRCLGWPGHWPHDTPAECLSWVTLSKGSAPQSDSCSDSASIANVLDWEMMVNHSQDSVYSFFWHSEEGAPLSQTKEGIQWSYYVKEHPTVTRNLLATLLWCSMEKQQGVLANSPGLEVRQLKFKPLLHHS